MDGSTPKIDDAPRSGEQDLAKPEQVLGFLQRNPEFLAENLELLAELSAPAPLNGGEVLDFRDFLVRRLQDDIAGLKRARDSYVASARAQRLAQKGVHQAVLALMGARSFQHLVHIVTVDLADLLHVDAVSLAVEGNGDDKTGPVGRQSVYVLAPGRVMQLMGGPEPSRMCNEGSAPTDVFGPAATLVRSQVLVRLQLSPRTPQGLLAIGARDKERFASGQTSRLLLFLAQVIEMQFRLWLDLPE